MQNLLEEYGGVIVSVILFGGVIAALYQLLDVVSSGIVY